MPLPALVIFGAWGLLAVVAIVVVLRAVRRRRAGAEQSASQGWTAVPDGQTELPGWDGWPFLRALEPGRASDVLVGHLQGARFMSLLWSQKESDPGEESNTDIERYNVVALATEQHYPHLSVVRGRYRIHGRHQHPGVTDFDTGDRPFDRRWQTLGDEEFGRALLSEEVRAAMDAQGHGWVVQPGWITRVVPWSFWPGEDRMVEEIERLAALMRVVPAEAWAAYGGPPRFLGNLGSR